MKERHKFYDAHAYTAITGATNASAIVDLDSFASCLVHVSTTVVGTSYVLTPQASPDGTNFGPMSDSAGTALTSGTINATGRRTFRFVAPMPRYLRFNADVTGTAVTAAVTVEGVKDGMP